MRKSKTDKLVDQRINAAFNRVGNCISIPIMKLGAISAAGRKAIEAGADDFTLDIVMATAIEEAIR